MPLMEVIELESRTRDFSTRRTPALWKGVALIAVSGGADSIATAALLCEARIINPARSAVGHFDHGLRGGLAAEGDLLAVRGVCDRYGLELIRGTWAEPQSGEGQARVARYAFLRNAVADIDAPVIVTGHTSDDHAETILMHAMRGAGLHGLRGILPQSAADGVHLARPALCLSRKETREYCQMRGLSFVDDPTNTDTALFRNRVRLELLPSLEATAPGARAALLRAGAEAVAAVNALEGLASSAVTRVGDHVVLSKQRLRALPPTAWPYALRIAVELARGHARDLSRKHYELMSTAMSARTGSLLQLPGGLALHVDSAAIVLARTQSFPCIAADFEASVPFNGMVGAWDLHVQPASLSESAVQLPPDSVVRRRRPGDRVQTCAGGRKLQDFFVDLKVPRRERDAIPLIASGSNILWTPVGELRTSQVGAPFSIRVRRGSIAPSLIDGEHIGRRKHVAVDQDRVQEQKLALETR